MQRIAFVSLVLVLLCGCRSMDGARSRESAEWIKDSAKTGLKRVARTIVDHERTVLIDKKKPTARLGRKLENDAVGIAVEILLDGALRLLTAEREGKERQQDD